MHAERQAFPLIAARPARADECALLWKWRNHPRVRAASFDDRQIPYPEHAAWFAQALADPSRAILVVEEGGEPAACVRFDRVGTSARVSIYADPARIGGGLGAPALQAAEQWVRASWHGVVRLVAETRPDNVRSQRAFAKAGYLPSGEAFVRILETPR